MFAYLSNSLEYVIPFLIVLTVLVFFHELGHFIVARWNGIKVNVFSIGFGPELFGWTSKSGVRWKFSMIPLGGYVMMHGDVDPSSQGVNPELERMSSEEKSQTLMGKTPVQRMAVSAAGPIANYLLAIVLLTGFFIFKGIPVPTNEVGTISAGSAAEIIGIKAGDKIVRINTHQITEFSDIKPALKGLKGHDVEIEVQRPSSLPKKTSDGEIDKQEHIDYKQLVLNGKMLRHATHLGIPGSNAAPLVPVSILGVTPGSQDFKPTNPFHSIGHSIYTCYSFSVQILDSLGQMIMGRGSADELGGILSISQGAQKSASAGFASFIWFIAIFSINLGLINLMPVPVVDGGAIVMNAIEAIRGKPVSIRAQEIVFGIGLLLIVSIMIFTTWNDLVRLQVIDWIKGLFG